MIFKLLNLVTHRARPQPPVGPASCPACGYIPERPHAFYCARCRTAIPGATGCSGCGRCRGGGAKSRV